MLKTYLRLAWRSFGHLTRIVMVGALLSVLAIASLMLGLRYWVLPDIERYHDVITNSVSKAIGQSVTIKKIEADWRGLRPHLSLTDVRILDKSRPGLTALGLQHVDGVVSWMTLLTGEVRLYSMEFDQPDLQVRRDAQGLLHIAGVALSDQSSGQNDLTDWLLHQTLIVVRDARITWLDEQRATPPLVFKQMNLLIENSGRHHRFALRAQPPAELSAQLDVRGDFYGQSFDDWNAWRGKLYTQLDYADVAAWRTWLPLPDGFKRGRGALRGWLDVADGQVSQLTADLALADVRAQLADGLSPLDVRALRGRIGWRESAQGFVFSTRQLSLQTERVVLPPTDFYLRLDYASDKQQAGGEMHANTLELANFASLTDSLPLSQELKKRLAEFAPRGTVSGLQAKWQGATDNPEHYRVKAHFDQLSLKRTDTLPGFSGLSGDLDGGDTDGALSLNARKLAVEAPGIMPEPLAFDTLTAQASWRADQQGMEVKFSNVSAANADLAGTVYGSFQTLPDSPGRIDLNINLTRAEIRHADRYIPVAALDKETHDWLRNALQGGQTDDFRLRLHGDLNDFPYADNKKGLFQIRSHIRGGVLEYHGDWPRIDNITGELLVQGKQLEVIAPTAMTVGARLQKVRVTMPDMTSPDMLLQVRGEAVGETARSLEFIQKSPVRGYIDGFTDGMAARGNGNLLLSVDVPLAGDKSAVVSGSYRFLDNEISLGDGAPVLYKANGELLFTESSMNIKNASAQILGGPATLEVQSGADGIVLAKVHGHADMDSLRKSVSHPLLSYLRGGSDWDAEVRVQKKLSNVLVTSNLSGLISSLPAPFAKDVGESIPLRFEMTSMVEQQDMISLQYGKLLGAKLLRREEGGDWVIKRGTVNFGGVGKWQNRDGLWLVGTLPQLSLEGWGALTEASGGAAQNAASPFNVAGADLLIQKLDAYGHGMNNLRVNARNQNGVITAQLAGKEINGEVIWQGQGKGKLVTRLKNLSLSGSEKKEDAARKPVVGESAASTEFPALDLVVDDLNWKNKQLGRMELMAQQQGRDWMLERVRITNPDGVLTADGKYHLDAGTAQTQVNLKLEISDAGKLLARSGYPNSVKNGSGKLEGEFAWRGGPDKFSYAKLDGSLKLDTGKGQFLKIDPGIGKLLGILSLQALPRHITLDFTDVFSAGFAFDSITGTSQIKQGVLTTSDFKIDGSSAKVTMQGQVDLARETQNLRIRILPTVGNSVSLLGAFAAGPAVGIGTFLVNKILREPLDKLASFEYNVTGTWINPDVVKIGAQASVSTNKQSIP